MNCTRRHVTEAADYWLGGQAHFVSCLDVRARPQQRHHALQMTVRSSPVQRSPLILTGWGGGDAANGATGRLSKHGCACRRHGGWWAAAAKPPARSRDTHSRLLKATTDSARPCIQSRNGNDRFWLAAAPAGRLPKPPQPRTAHLKCNHGSLSSDRIWQWGAGGRRGAFRTSHFASLSAPASSSAVTHCKLPASAALCNGVSPSWGGDERSNGVSGRG